MYVDVVSLLIKHSLYLFNARLVPVLKCDVIRRIVVNLWGFLAWTSIPS